MIEAERGRVLSTCRIVLNRGTFYCPSLSVSGYPRTGFANYHVFVAE